MSYKFLFENIESEGKVKFSIEKKSILGNTSTVKYDRWKDLDQEKSLSEGLDILGILREEDEHSHIDVDALYLDQKSIFKVLETKKHLLGLPPIVPFIAQVERTNSKIITDDDFNIRIRWLNEAGRVIPAKRYGVILKAGPDDFCLNEPLYLMSKEIERFEPQGKKSDSLKVVSNFLKNNLKLDKALELDEYFETINIAHASSFTLDVDPNSIDFNPRLINKQRELVDDGDVIYEKSEELDVMPLAQEKIFLEKFNGEKDLDVTVVLNGHGQNTWFMVMDEPVLKSLKIVKEKRKGTREEKQEFLRNPREFLLDIYDSNSEQYSQLIEDIFVEPENYSDRVVEMAQFQKPVLPWIKQSANEWVPEGACCGIKVNNEFIPIKGNELEAEYGRVEKALKNGEQTIEINGHDVPLNNGLLESIGTLIVKRPNLSGDHGIDDTKIKKNNFVLVVKDNFEVITHQEVLKERSELNLNPPVKMSAIFKKHQKTGYKWLIKSWNSGRSGVLLADDMGLGKTLLSLGLICKLQQEKESRILVVAPTALLKTWHEETEKHFKDGAFGEILTLFGSKVREYKNEKSIETEVGRSLLDIESISKFNLILTTYETVRNYQHSIAKIDFDITIFDEAQKVKTPGIAITESAKALKSGFKIAVTGTPVENRMADLWSIVDLIEPSYFGDLKTFSQKYERPEDPPLSDLYKRLIAKNDKIPNLMLRRMKSDHLEGLPKKTIIKYPYKMPKIQQEADEDVRNTSYAGIPGAKLKMIQQLRNISLHPAVNIDPDDEFINLSARFQAAFKVLRDVKAKEQKAIVFIENRDVQRKFIVIAKREFSLVDYPMIINGQVSGPLRQTKVNKFNENTSGFDLMVLSPKAAGVGLTITSANHVIHLSRWWNPAVEDQCSDRVYRIGQLNPVFIHIPQAINPNPKIGEKSFDLILDNLLEKKRSLQDGVLISFDKDKDTDDFYSDIINSDNIDDEDKYDDGLLRYIDQSEPIYFEDIVLDIYKKGGYRTKKTGRSYDGGSDGFAEKDGITRIFQCKHKQNISDVLDKNAIKEIVNAKNLFRSDDGGKYNSSNSKLIVVTNAEGYTRNARELASKHNVVLISRNEITSLPL